MHGVPIGDSPRRGMRAGRFGAMKGAAVGRPPAVGKQDTIAVFPARYRGRGRPRGACRRGRIPRRRVTTVAGGAYGSPPPFRGIRHDA